MLFTLKDRKVIFIGVIALLIVGKAYIMGYDRAETKWERRTVSDYIAKEEATRAVQLKVIEVSKDYQEKLAQKEQDSLNIINKLSADGKRLRVKLKAAESKQGDCGFIIDGKAELDAADAQRIISITTQGDLWIESLQNTIRELQGGVDEE